MARPLFYFGYYFNSLKLFAWGYGPSYEGGISRRIAPGKKLETIKIITKVK
jgi:hypothetical protein